MPGWESQEIGDVGQDLVRATLSSARFAVGSLEPDLGEDLWIEVEGRKAAAEASPPLRALLQVKGSKRSPEATFSYDVASKDIKRWAAQPLPVFVVGVTIDAPHRYYSKSIDTIISDDLGGKDPMQLATETVRVHLTAAPDLAERLKAETATYYDSMRLVLAELPESEIEQHYFEILGKKAPHLFTPLASWRVLWKSLARPQHFAAMLTELARRAQQEYSQSFVRPAYVIFHVYRSLFDEQRNLATARVDWIDPTHPKAEDIVEILGAPGFFRLRHDRDVPEIREFLRARTAAPDEYLDYASQAGSAFDALTEVILKDPSADVWTPTLRARFDEVDTLWEKGPYAPVAHGGLEKALKAQHDALFEHHFVSIYRRQKLPAETVTKLLTQTAAKLADCKGAWRIFLPQL